MLTIKGDGSKLIPFIIFKGKHNSNLYKKLKNLQVFKDKLIYITTNENAWMTSDLFIEYIENILAKNNNKKNFLYWIIVLLMILL